MVESIDAGLTIALGTFKSETKKSKATKKEKEIADKLGWEDEERKNH